MEVYVELEQRIVIKFLVAVGVASGEWNSSYIICTI